MTCHRQRQSTWIEAVGRESQGHYAEQKLKDPGLDQENGPQQQTANQMPQAAETHGGKRERQANSMKE